MLFVSLLLSSILLSNASNCAFKNPVSKENYDLSAFKGLVMEGADAKVSTYQYKASVCSDMTDICDDIMTGKKSNGCTYQFGGEPGGKSVCWDVLAYWDDEAVTVADLDPSASQPAGTEGISLSFKNGDECRNNPRENTMNFICDKTVPTSKPGYQLEGSQDPNDSCHFIINIKSSHGCPGGSPKSGSTSGSSGLSGGWIFIILIIILPIFYFATVFGYRGYTTKEWKSSENCPHLDLCKTFPLWVKTGCMVSGVASKNGCMWLMSKCKKGDDDYETSTLEGEED